MAVIKVDELLEGRGASTDDQGVITAKRMFVAKTDNQGDGIVKVTAAVNTFYGIHVYAPHPEFYHCRARTISAEQWGDTKTWRVTWNYSSAPMFLRGAGYSTGFPEALSTSSPSQPSDQSQQPAPNRTPEIKWSKIDKQVGSRTSIGGFPFKNSAGDPYENIVVDRPQLAIDIKYWSLNVTVSHIIAKWFTVNNAVWNGFPRRTLLVADFQVVPKYDIIGSGFDATGLIPQPIYGLVSECTVRLEYNKDSWLLSLADTGRREKVAGKLKAIVGDDGKPVDHPVLLNGSGVRWDGTGTPPDPRTYPVYEEVDFGGLLI